MDKIYNLTIDTKRKSYNKVLGIKQNENNVVLNITLVQNSIALDLTDCTVRLNYLNNNNVLLQMADIVEVKEGKIKVNVLTKVLKDIGETPVDISIFDKDNRKITSATFTIVVQASIYTNDKLDKEELDLIQDIYNKEETRILNEETRQANEKQRKINENTRITNEKERQENESIRYKSEKERITNEKERIKSEVNRSDIFDKLKQQTEENIETQNKNIAIQEKEIQENKEINSNITTAEKERVISENNRQQGYSEMKNTINDFSICEIYNSDKKYKKFNRVVFDGSSYECLKECQHINPSSTEYWICIAQKGQDGKGTGDMQTSIYDKNNNGIVDVAEDAKKLNGKAAKEFIKYNDAQTYFTFYVDEKEGNDVCSNFPNDNHVFKTFNAAAKHCKRVCNHFGTYCNIDLRTDSHADTIFLERTKIKINGNGHTIKSEYGTNTWYIEEGYLEAKNVKIHCQQFNITRGSIALDEVEIIKTKYNYAMIYALQSNVCFKKCILRGTKDEETNFSSGFYAVNGTIATFEEGKIINCDPAICSFASNVFLASAPLFENCKNKTSIGKAGNIFKTGKNEYE